ncbi:chemotaxis protein CheW [soil metagenome]
MSATHVRVRVGEEHYALPIEEVTEVSELPVRTPVPEAPSTVLGVASLRGQVIPVADRAAILGVGRSEHPDRMVVAKVGGHRAGLAVDAVTDVGVLPTASEPAGGRHLAGAALVEGDLVGLLAVGSVLDAIGGGRG